MSLPAARIRTFQEEDFPALEATDLAAQRALDPGYDALPERERTLRLSTSLPALKFYERSEHSFVAERGGEVQGFVLAQSVWQGDRPAVFVRSLLVGPQAPSPDELRAALLHAVVKSAYDSAVYEVHFLCPPPLRPAAAAEEARILGDYAVIHLGTRAQSAPGERLSSQG